MALLLPDGDYHLGKNERHPDDIELHSRARNHIDNRQCRDRLTLWNQKESQEKADKYKNGGVLRKRADATAMYNCHGLTFASRRTILGPDAVKVILEEDKYETIEPKDVIEGDVILYESATGDIEHSGIVVGLPKTSYEMPLIVSKWGIGPEYLHHANNCDYDPSRVRYVRATGYETKQSRKK